MNMDIFEFECCSLSEGMPWLTYKKGPMRVNSSGLLSFNVLTIRG